LLTTDSQTRKIAERITRLPDDIVETASLEDKFKIAFYLDKKEIIETPERIYVEALLKKK
jgi:hypothetical protein